MRKEFWRLQTNTRELFKRWKEIKEDSKYDNRYTQT